MRSFIVLLVIVLVNISISRVNAGVALSQSSSSILKKIEKRGDVVPITAAAVKKGTVPAAASTSAGLPDIAKLLIGAGGIYAAFLYYGTLQEDVFHYKASDGSQFKFAWFLQTLEALANVIIGGVGMHLAGPTKGLPLKQFMLSGTFQVCAKAFTSLALASGVSFPVVTLAKSGKMVPVMIGTLLLGGAKYTLREYAAVSAIIAGTVLVSLGKKSGPASSLVGILFIFASLTCDGVTGGMQNRIKNTSKALGVKPKPYDFMFWTNLFMAAVATVISLAFGEFTSGIEFCTKNPLIFNKILKFAACSAVGQSFIFYTLTNFDSLVTTTVTTTRKVFSVLISIFINGHSLSNQGWVGIALASAGILSELQHKGSKDHSTPAKKDDKKK